MKVTPRLHKHLEPSKYIIYIRNDQIAKLILHFSIIAPRNVGPGSYLAKKNSLGGPPNASNSGFAVNSG